MPSKSKRLRMYWRFAVDEEGNLRFDSQKDFAKYLGVDPTTLGTRLDTIDSPNSLVEILKNKCPDLNIDWFLRGEGEMLRLDNVTATIRQLQKEIDELVRNTASESEQYRAVAIIKESHQKIKSMQKQRG